MLPQPTLEAALDRVVMVGGPKRLNQLRESLARCNAFQEDLRSYKLLFPPAKLVS